SRRQLIGPLAVLDRRRAADKRAGRVDVVVAVPGLDRQVLADLARLHIDGIVPAAGVHDRAFADGAAEELHAIDAVPRFEGEPLSHVRVIQRDDGVALAAVDREALVDGAVIERDDLGALPPFHAYRLRRDTADRDRVAGEARVVGGVRPRTHRVAAVAAALAERDDQRATDGVLTEREVVAAGAERDRGLVLERVVVYADALAALAALQG